MVTNDFITVDLLPIPRVRSLRRSRWPRQCCSLPSSRSSRPASPCRYLLLPRDWRWTPSRRSWWPCWRGSRRHCTCWSWRPGRSGPSRCWPGRCSGSERSRRAEQCWSYTWDMRGGTTDYWLLITHPPSGHIILLSTLKALVWQPPLSQLSQ